MKQADNNIISKKDRIDSLNEQIYSTNKQVKNINNMEEEYNLLNKQLNKCIELLSQSMDGATIRKKLDNMQMQNKLSYKKSMLVLDESRDNLNKQIKHLNELKDDEKEDSK